MTKLESLATHTADRDERAPGERPPADTGPDEGSTAGGSTTAGMDGSTAGPVPDDDGDATDVAAHLRAAEGHRIRRMFTDSAVIAFRNILTIRRVPTLLVSATVQPLMFVVLFAYVFGASLGGGEYREFLMAGIFTQTVVFNAAFTTVGLSGDLQHGLIDRFRSLPMSRLAVVLGRTVSDFAVNAISVIVMVGCGYLIGWRITGGVGAALAAFGILALFAFAMSWVGVLTGLLARSVEVAQSVGFLWMFPLTFISSAFISAQSLPGPLRAIAEWNPITAVATSGRQLFGNPAPPDFPVASGWSADNASMYALLCAVVIIVVFATLSLLSYRRVARA
ncbi:ABC transporter permease [Tomitella cavernea]|uniref:Transport permease protein n=1 Tax=Tomitella cavernea TaxID=1387982 RepID=A0ABP9CF81_9ACTN|nr:ABC transporter permease [Tomitella cavernea]